MKTRRSLLIRALQERFVPILLRNGFTQSKLTGADAASGTIRRAFPFGCMKRPKGVDIELLDIQMHPRGKLKFVVNFGVAPPEGVEFPWAKFEQHEVDSLRPVKKLPPVRQSVLLAHEMVFGLTAFADERY